LNWEQELEKNPHASILLILLLSIKSTRETVRGLGFLSLASYPNGKLALLRRWQSVSARPHLSQPISTLFTAARANAYTNCQRLKK
jgi:hypothetical protein